MKSLIVFEHCGKQTIISTLYSNDPDSASLEGRHS